MSFGYLHLVMNHIPVVGIPVVLAFLGFGLWTRNTPAQRFSLLLLVGFALLIVPVYMTGEPAEEVVEHLPGVAESLIHAHEEAAEVSLIITLVGGAMALVALLFPQDERRRRLASIGTLVVATIAFASLVYTASLGGKIRHTEFGSGADVLSSESLNGAEGKEKKNAEDDN